MIYIRSQKEIAAIEYAGRILAQTFEKLIQTAKEGVSTKELDMEAEEFIRKKGAIPAFKGYRGFPASSCMSINEEIVHGIPSKRRLKNGDLISIDLGVEKDGFFADAALTLGIGKIGKTAQNLIKIAQLSLLNGIAKARPGERISDISHSIEQTAHKGNFSVVREYVGHGIGTELHEEPPIPNYGKPHMGPRIKKGMVLAIEPMLCVGSWKTEVLNDGWTVVTKDKKLSVHFEHTVVVTDGAPRILTLWQKKNLLQ